MATCGSMQIPFLSERVNWHIICSVPDTRPQDMPRSISKVICLTLLFLYLCSNVAAQDSTLVAPTTFRNELNLSVGHWSADMLTVGWGGQHRTVSMASYSGAYNLAVRRRWGSNRWVGLGVGYEQASGDVLKIHITGRTAFNADTIGRYRMNVYSVAPEVIFVFDHDTDRNSYLYALVAGGVSLVTRNDEIFPEVRNYPAPGTVVAPAYSKRRTSIHFNGQVSPLCFKVGAHRLSGFLEIGFGYKGIVCGGLVWRC